MYPEYEALENQLMNLQAAITPAELQGILVGFYAAGMPLTQGQWSQQLLQLVSDDDGGHPVPARSLYHPAGAAINGPHRLFNRLVVPARLKI